MYTYMYILYTYAMFILTIHSQHMQWNNVIIYHGHIAVRVIGRYSVKSLDIAHQFVRLLQGNHTIPQIFAKYTYIHICSYMAMIYIHIYIYTPISGWLQYHLVIKPWILMVEWLHHARRASQSSNRIQPRLCASWFGRCKMVI